MKTTMKILPLMLGIMLFFTQCEKEASDKGSTFSEDVMTLKSDCDPVVQTLWAGAGQNDISKADSVGYVTATLLEDNQLQVEYLITVNGYSLTEVHLWVGKDKSVGVFPRQAAPGRFPYKANLDFGTIQWDTIVDLDFDPGEHIIYVSAHGVVVFGETDGVYDLEGLEALLPIHDAEFFIQANYNTSYHDLFLSQAGDFFNGEYQSYCIDPTKGIGENKDYITSLYSSLSNDPDLIGLVPIPKFNELNWIINNVSVGATEVNGTNLENPITYADIQMAIWELLYGPDLTPTLSGSTPANIFQIVENAKDNPTYWPGCNDKLVILLVPDNPNVQPHLIWKDIPCIEFGSETVWAYGEHTFIELGIAKKWGWIFEVNCTTP